MTLSSKKGVKSRGRSSHLEIDDEHYEITEQQVLPGFEYKSKLGPSSVKHQKKLNLTTDNGEARFLGSVKKELSKKTTIHKLQTAYQSNSEGGTELGNKTVYCTNQDITIQLSSPLADIAYPHYIQNNQNPELVKDLPTQTGESGEEDNGSPSGDDHEENVAAAKLAAKPSVLAVNLKWRPGITLKRVHKYTTKTTQLEPLMRKTEFDYETKTKFENQLDSACDDLFPDWRRKLMILDGNNCHHGLSFVSASSSSSSGGRGNSSGREGSKLARSERLQEDDSPAAPHKPDPFARQWKEYSDLDEHKILVIPNYSSKNGFETDPSLRYQLPYQAKFVIGRRAYHHKFMLQLPITKAPQHYGLIFTFSEDPKGHSKIRIKSLLTVYCVFPTKPKFACLETYEANPDSQDYANEEAFANKKKNGGGASAKMAKSAVHLLTDNLKESNLMSNGYGRKNYEMAKKLPQPGEKCYRDRRLYRNDYNPEGVKQKRKNEIKKSIKVEQSRM